MSDGVESAPAEPKPLAGKGFLADAQTSSTRAGWLARVRAAWRERPLRARLTMAAGLAAAIGIVAVVGVAWVVVRHEIVGGIDGQLRQQATSLRQQATEDIQQGFPILTLTTNFGDVEGYAQTVSAFGNARPSSTQTVVLPVSDADVQVAATQRGSGIRAIRIGDVHARMITAPLVPGYAVQVALPTTAADRQLSRVLLALALLTVAGVGAAAGLSWLAARAALAPVAVLTAAAEQVAATRDPRHRMVQTRSDELGRLAASFNTMLDALAEAMDAQRQLVADASHELRTPLAALRTNVEILREADRLPDGTRREIVADIVVQSEELTTLVGDVVELARGDGPVDRLEPVPFDHVAEAAVARARRHWPKLTFRTAIAPVTVRASAHRLDRAVTNLLDNAGKFSPSGTVVDVSLTPDGTFAVRDRGPGVAADALPHVFDRFFRAEEARALPGSGLGLAIVRQTAASHQGWVRLRNSPDGVGAIAELHLPPYDAATAGPDDPSPGGEDPSPGGEAEPPALA